jgi:SH3 domain-containing YSC84-like protein 1
VAFIDRVVHDGNGPIRNVLSHQKGLTTMKFLVTALLGVGFAGMMVASDEDTQRLKASGEVLQEVMATPDKGIPSGLFKKAYCVVVIPSMKKAGFIFSGKYGRGYAACRKEGGGWTGPAAMRIEGGGFGLQVGGSATDLVMLVMSKKGMDGIMASKFTLGGEASVAAGPVGRDTTAQTDATMRADILSWSRSRGVFGGISLQGGTLRGDEDADKSLYGKKVTNREILTGKVAPPPGADAFTQKLVQYGGRTEAARLVPSIVPFVSGS